MRHNKPDFGNTIVTLGAEEDEQSSSKSQQEAEGEEDAGTGCSKSMCSGMAAAATTALGALGPASKPIPQDQLNAMAADKSAAGQAQYEAALKHNEEVNKQNAERQGIIDQFVKDAVGGKVTREQMALGDAAHAEYEKLVAKYGEDTRYLTLEQMVSKYPQDSRAVVTSLAQVFPALRGKSFEQIWAGIPQAFKKMTLIDLEKAIPNSSWVGTKTSSGQAAAPGMAKAGLVVGALVLGGIAFALSRRKSV